jgi:hypothetical protein
MKLQAGIDIREVQQRIGVGKDEELRESEKRRRYLQGFSRLITPVRPVLKMIDELPTAAVNQKEDDPVILMTTREFDQPYTGFSQRVFDMVMQEALTVHEIGHILYTDNESFKTYLGQVDMDGPGSKSMFKRVWNTLEDGAIEEQLRHEYDVESEIFALNSNLFENDEIGHVVDEEGDVKEIRFSFIQAVLLGLSDMAVYDSGKYQKLIDADNTDLQMSGEQEDLDLLNDFTPEMKSVVADVKSQPNSEKRNERIFEFWEVLQDYLDDAEVDGASESHLNDMLDSDGNISFGGDDSQSGDSDEDGGDGDSNAPVEGKPDDTQNEFSGQVREANELNRQSVQQQVVIQVQQASGDDPVDGQMPGGSQIDQEAAEDAESGSGDGESDDTDGDENDEGGLQDGEMKPEMEEQYQQELAQEAANLDGGQAMLDEIEEFLEIIEDAAANAGQQQMGGGALDEWRGLTLDIPEGDSYSEDRWDNSVRRGNRLARVFKNRLQWNQRTREKTRQRRGQFDVRRGMIPAARGQTDVFKRQEESQEKDYDCIFVLDRSGSMGGQDIRDAEEAIGSLAYALQKVGVNTSILDLYGSQARLALAFGQDMMDQRKVMFSGDTSGGTPLAEVVHLARKRVQGEDSEPFMIVVTDGAPGNRDKYINELNNCNFPVLGVYLTNSRGSHAEDENYFHRTVYVTGQEEMDTALMNLAQDIMF